MLSVLYNHLLGDYMVYRMDAIKSYTEGNALIQKLLAARGNGSQLDDELLEDTVNYMLGHLEQINKQLEIIGGKLDAIIDA